MKHQFASTPFFEAAISSFSYYVGIFSFTSKRKNIHTVLKATAQRKSMYNIYFIQHFTRRLQTTTGRFVYLSFIGIQNTNVFFLHIHKTLQNL